MSLVTWMVREQGADPLFVDKYGGDTSMHWACRCDKEDEFNNSVKVVDFLVECGVDPAKRGRRGWLPSHVVAALGNVPALRRLIEHFGVSADAADDHGSTHLHYAASWGSGAIPYLAVNAQASIHAKTKVRCLFPIPLFFSLTSSSASPIITVRRDCS